MKFADSRTRKKIPKFTVKIPELYGQNELIERLSNMTVEERKALGIRKNTLWYIQQNLKKGKQGKVYAKVKQKL